MLACLSGILGGLRGEPRKAIAVVGDGALSAGMAFDALSYAGGFAEFDAELVCALARRHELLVTSAFNCWISVQCAA